MHFLYLPGTRVSNGMIVDLVSQISPLEHGAVTTEVEQDKSKQMPLEKLSHKARHIMEKYYKTGKSSPKSTRLNFLHMDKEIYHELKAFAEENADNDLFKECQIWLFQSLSTENVFEWRERLEADGDQWGKELAERLITLWFHPALEPFSQLPPEQQDLARDIFNSS